MLCGGTQKGCAYADRTVIVGVACMRRVARNVCCLDAPSRRIRSNFGHYYIRQQNLVADTGAQGAIEGSCACVADTLDEWCCGAVVEGSWVAEDGSREGGARR